MPRMIDDETREIPLTLGRVVIVDSDDFEWLSKYHWFFSARGYARRSVDRTNGQNIYMAMHREIMKCPDGLQVDHINGNKLDNRKCNLRICTKGQNNQNVGKRRNNTSGYKGVYWRKKERVWISVIQANGIQRHLGQFPTKELAREAYIKSAKELHGEFARW